MSNLSYSYEEEANKPFDVRKCFNYEGYMNSVLRNYPRRCARSYEDHKHATVYWSRNAPLDYMPPASAYRVADYFLNPISDHVDFILHAKKEADGLIYTIDEHKEIVPFVDDHDNQIYREGYIHIMEPMDGKDADRLARIIVPMYLIAKWDKEDKEMDHEEHIRRVNNRALRALYEWASINFEKYPDQIYKGCTVTNENGTILPTYYVNPIVFTWLILGIMPIPQHDDDSVVSIPHFLYPNKHRFGLNPGQKLYIGIVKNEKLAQMESKFRYFLMEDSISIDDPHFRHYPIFMNWMDPLQLAYYLEMEYPSTVGKDPEFMKIMHTDGDYDYFHHGLRRYILMNFDKFTGIETDSNCPYDYLVLG